MADVLSKILDYKKEELASFKRQISLSDMIKRAGDTKEPADFKQALKKQNINIIAEIKQASPSQGQIRQDFKPVDYAMSLEDAGACALSILTDEAFFKGKIEYLQEIAKKVKLPLLRKDFTIDEYHLYQAKAYGASAILLIVRALDDYQLKDYLSLTHELEMNALIEVHELSEVKRIEKLKEARIVGINNRDLTTLKTDIEQSLKLKDYLKSNWVWVSESGFDSAAAIYKINEAGFGAFLIGQALMSEKTPSLALKKLLSFES